jgi:hypothetical protein
MEDLDKEEDKEYQAKKLSLYSASVSAWFTTRFERDKQLLGLSVTCIGLLVTLLRIVGASSYLQLWLFIGSLFFFLITVISIICIFDQNAVHIEEVLKGDEQENKVLKKLDKIAAISFVVAMILIIMIGINYSLLNLSKQEKNMSKEQPNNSQRKINHDSVNGFVKLIPQQKTPTNSNTGSNSTSASLTAGENEAGNNTTSTKAD